MALFARSAWLRCFGRRYNSTVAEGFSLQNLDPFAAASTLQLMKQPEQLVGLEGFVGRAQAILQSKSRNEPAPSFIKSDEEWLQSLKRVVLFVPDDSHRLRANTVLRVLRYPNAFSLLVDLNMLDTSGSIGRSAVNELPSRLESDAISLAQEFEALGRTRVLDEPNRVDFRHCVVYTIDDASTTDPDDGISIEPLSDGSAWVRIHIADPACLVSINNPLDLAARERAKTVYLPEFRSLMFPSILSEEVFPLLSKMQHIGVPALTFSAKVSGNGTILDINLNPSILGNINKLSYDQADTILKTGPSSSEDQTHQHLAQLLSLSQKLKAKRVERGAFDLNLPQTSIKIDPITNAINITAQHDYLSPSKTLIQELMLTAGQIAATFARDMRVSIPFRTQQRGMLTAPLRDILYESTIKNVPIYANFWRVMNVVPPGKTTTRTGEHWMLGVSNYTRSTSPIRRYSDLLVHYQLKAALGGQLPISETDMNAIIKDVIVQEKEAMHLESISQRRWVARYYSALPPGTPLTAIVLSPADNIGNIQIMLVDTAYRGKVVQTKVVQPGETIQVYFHRVDARHWIQFSMNENFVQQQQVLSQAST